MSKIPSDLFQIPFIGSPSYHLTNICEKNDLWGPHQISLVVQGYIYRTAVCISIVCTAIWHSFSVTHIDWSLQHKNRAKEKNQKLVCRWKNKTERYTILSAAQPLDYSSLQAGSMVRRVRGASNSLPHECAIQNYITGGISSVVPCMLHMQHTWRCPSWNWLLQWGNVGRIPHLLDMLNKRLGAFGCSWGWLGPLSTSDWWAWWASRIIIGCGWGRAPHRGQWLALLVWSLSSILKLLDITTGSSKGTMTMAESLEVMISKLQLDLGEQEMQRAQLQALWMIDYWTHAEMV